MTTPSSAQPLGIEITVPEPDRITLYTPGPQGPPGVQNLHVGPTPPSNPMLNMIWVDTS